MRVVSLTVALVLVFGMHVTADDVVEEVMSCFTGMSTDINCDGLKGIIKCVFQKEHLDTLELSDANLNSIKNSINSATSRLGLSCDIDYKRLVHEINSGPTTVGYEISACILASVTSGAYMAPNCDAVRNVSACVFKEAGITNATLGTNTSRAAISDIESTQSRFGLTCQTDFESVAVEVQREQSTKTPTKYSDAATVEGCFAVLRSQPFAICDDAEVYTKCAIRVTNANKLKIELPAVFYQVATASFAKAFNHNAQTCNLDAKSVVQAAINDLNSGSVSGPIHLFTLTAISTLLFFILY